MKVACLSDIHGHLPEIEPCDLLLLAGDLNNIFKYTEQEAMNWLDIDFRVWLDTIPVDKVIGVAGNHDFVFENRPQWVRKLDLNWEYLEDEGTIYKGYNIWGSPWQPVFGRLAFNADEEELERRFDWIPNSTEILVTHGPPRNILDSTYHGDHVGSSSLLRRVEKLPKLTLSVFGHIHPARGTSELAGATFVNATHVNFEYQSVYDPIYLTLPDK